MHPKCPPRCLPLAPQALSANVEQLAEHEEAVRGMLSTIFDQVRSRAGAAARVRAHASAHHGASFSLSPQVISYRYRDTHEDIRAACISSLGRGLRVLPSFCEKKHLEYMDRQLSDIQSASVRLASLQASALYAIAHSGSPSPP